MRLRCEVAASSCRPRSRRWSPPVWTRGWRTPRSRCDTSTRRTRGGTRVARRSGDSAAEPELRAYLLADRVEFRHDMCVTLAENPSWSATAWAQLSPLSMRWPPASRIGCIGGSCPTRIRSASSARFTTIWCSTSGTCCAPRRCRSGVNCAWRSAAAQSAQHLPAAGQSVADRPAVQRHGVIGGFVAAGARSRSCPARGTCSGRPGSSGAGSSRACCVHVGGGGSGGTFPNTYRMA